jgi:hypothetical protein
VSEHDNDTFLDLLEDFFNQPDSELKKDERPELSYQVGVTLENTEKPKCAVDEPCLRIIDRLDPAERPLDITAHSPDPKCRFFWRIGEKPPYQTQYPALNAPNVVPQAERLRIRWGSTMEAWGKAMKNAYVVSPVHSATPHDLADSVENLAEMAAVGLGLPEDTFRNAGRYGYVHLTLAMTCDSQTCWVVLIYWLLLLPILSNMERRTPSWLVFTVISIF